MFEKIKIPTQGEMISLGKNNKLIIPDQPIIPYIEGDGIGIDITSVMKKVVDAAVAKAYNNTKKVSWMEIYAGEKATTIYKGKKAALSEETLDAIRKFKIAIKGPLTTPVGGGFRSLNVALRQKLDLYVCLRPVRYFRGTPSAIKQPELVDMVIFRENSEDIYAGIEWRAGTPEAKEMIQFLREKMGVTQIAFPKTSSIGIKPVSEQGTTRFIRKAIDYTIENNRDSITIVHKGNIMKFTEGAFKDWAYGLAVNEYGAKPYEGGPWHTIINPNTGKEIIVKDVIADAFLQQMLLRPKEYDVIATLNLNGDYISDALAAQVGGIGIAPGANLSDQLAVFEATHGTAPKYTGQDKVNPGSLILSAEMMLRHMGWFEAADLIIKGMEGAISASKVTYDLARLVDDATLLSCSEFGDEIINQF